MLLHGWYQNSNVCSYGAGLYKAFLNKQLAAMKLLHSIFLHAPVAATTETLRQLHKHLSSSCIHFNYLVTIYFQYLTFFFVIVIYLIYCIHVLVMACNHILFYCAFCPFVFCMYLYTVLGYHDQFSSQLEIRSAFSGIWLDLRPHPLNHQNLNLIQ